MTLDYSDPLGYWRNAGQHFVGFAVPQSREHLAQQQALTPHLEALEWGSILDVGCGWGRLAKFLKNLRPEASYTGLDVGESQIGLTRKVRPDAELINSSFQDFETNRRWDLVITSEVVMHVPPAEVHDFIHKLKGLARKHLVLVEWSDPNLKGVASWNFAHDYPALLGRVNHTPIPEAKQHIFTWSR